MDECSIDEKTATKKKHYGVKGEQSYQLKVSGLSGHVTSVMGISAGGKVLPNFLIYAESLPMLTVTQASNLPSKWIHAATPSGYIDSELFVTWMKDIFVPNCGQERPVLLTMDNLDAHMSLQVVDLARENNIEILTFPSHMTHILQPLDVGFFDHVKKAYRQRCIDITTANMQNKVAKATFAPVWSCAVKQGGTPNTIKASFQRTGLFPFDPTAIDSSKLIQRRVEHNTPKDAFIGPILIKNPAVDVIAPDLTRQCPTCYRYPNPIGAVAKLPAELEKCFPFPEEGLGRENGGARKEMSSRIQREGSLITSDNIYQQIKEKHERTVQEASAKEERKRKREEAQRIKEEKAEEKKIKITEEDKSDSDFQLPSTSGVVSETPTRKSGRISIKTRQLDESFIEVQEEDVSLAPTNVLETPTRKCGHIPSITMQPDESFIEVHEEHVSLAPEVVMQTPTRKSSRISIKTRKLNDSFIEFPEEDVSVAIPHTPVIPAPVIPAAEIPAPETQAVVTPPVTPVPATPKAATLTAVTPTPDTLVAISEEDNDMDLCYVCKGEEPPMHLCKGKGRGKGKKRKIDWVGCDKCPKWFHCLCVGHKLLKGAKSYKCSYC